MFFVFRFIDSELKDRIVLVVHPFSKTIRSQYMKHRRGQLLFSRQDILPEFQLKTVKSIMTLAGTYQ